MSTLTIESSRFGTLEIASEHVIEFPAGLIGLGGSRYALLTAHEDAAFAWLHSLEDPDLALPVTNPWAFFADYAVELSDEETARTGITDPAGTDVWVTVRAAGDLADFSANLRAPILVAGGRGHQVINAASDAPVRAALFGPAVFAAEHAA
jgi:flagellar assembly factor FliW